MKVLVTGATGFIGSHLITELLKLGYQVVATSKNLDNGKTFSWIEKVEYLECDLNDKQENFFQFFKTPDLMIHLAWEGLPNYNAPFHLEKNRISNYFFVKNIVENGLKNVVITGTCLEYGMQEGLLKEDMPTKPITSYGLAKDSLRKLISELNEKIDFNFKWIRLFYIYGKNKENGIISQLEESIRNGNKIFNMSGGKQLRDFLPIEKVSKYIVKIVMQNKVNGIINCCSGKPISVRKFIEDYLKAENKSIELNLGYYPYPHYEPMAFWGDNTKLKKILKNDELSDL